eukprot:TRINITY_DN6564_c0_g1_i1.p1 TRINITY_DN6564_c0_g1~~TRINITY_DN6564_c0_g1_i1.p1  ORF type:complete len:350 (+),score=38.20 TRINITY_DN6564_c0_g1_i1:78-1127(+)
MTALEWVVTCFGLLVELAFVTLFVRQLCGKNDKIRRELKGLWFWIRSHWTRSDVELDSLVEDEILEMQDVLFKYYIDMHQILNILVIITLQIRAAVGAERWGSLGLELSLIVGATFKWIHDASQRVLPQQYRTNICCILLTLQALVMMHPSSVAPKFVQDWFVIIFIFGRIPASAVTPSKYIIIYGNVAFLLMALYRFWCDGDPTKSFLEASTAPDKYIMDEVLYGVATVSSALAFQTFLRDRVRHGIMAKTTSSHLHASRSLLGLVCDSVVDLDDSFVKKKTDFERLGPTLLAGLSGGLLAAPSLSEQKLPSSGQGAGSNSSDHSSDSIDGLDSMSADLREARKIQSL